MDEIITAILFILTGVSRSHAIFCYKYDTGGTGVPQPIHGVTCPQTASSCLTTTTIIQGQITRRQYLCSPSVNCNTVAMQKNSTYITVQNCCHDDLCNNEKDIQPTFDSGKRYCYSANCNGDNCLAELLASLDRHDLGAFCSQDGEQCLTQRRKLTNTDTSNTIRSGVEITSYEYWTGCATSQSPCYPMTTTDMTVTCCADHLCNGIMYDRSTSDKPDVHTTKPNPNVPTTEPTYPQTNQTQCYVVSCTGDGCLQESIQLGSYTVCTLSNTGCEATLTKTGGQNIYSLGCTVTQCVLGTRKPDNRTVIGCCNGDHCFPKLQSVGTNAATYLTISRFIILSFLVASSWVFM